MSVHSKLLASLWLALLALFASSYIAYFSYLKIMAGKNWGLKIDTDFFPDVTVLIPAHNEEATIESKLDNIKGVLYPKEKIKIIVADDASNDNTGTRVETFAKQNPELNIRLVNQNPRAGKSRTLNKALVMCTTQIVVVSDADTLWPTDILKNALPYLSNSRIGAVSGWGVNKNVKQSWVVKAENTYLNFINSLRLGESKIHSTIRFEGGFCAYKRNVLENFDCETGSDDSGTALEIIQKGYRAILIPEAFFYTSFPTNLVGKLKVKTRRANQLMGLWFKCLKLLLTRKLLLPKRIAIPEITLFLVNPLIFLILVIMGAILIINSLFSNGLVAFIIISILLLFARRIFLEFVIDQLILLYALVTFVFKKRYIAWEKPIKKERDQYLDG